VAAALARAAAAAAAAAACKELEPGREGETEEGQEEQ